MNTAFIHFVALKISQSKVLILFINIFSQYKKNRNKGKQ